MEGLSTVAGCCPTGSVLFLIVTIALIGGVVSLNAADLESSRRVSSRVEGAEPRSVLFSENVFVSRFSQNPSREGGLERWEGLDHLCGPTGRNWTLRLRHPRCRIGVIRTRDAKHASHVVRGGLTRILEVDNNGSVVPYRRLQEVNVSAQLPLGVFARGAPQFVSVDRQYPSHKNESPLRPV